MTHSPFLDEVKDAVTPRATLLVLGVVALSLLFITSYVGALHDPDPKDVPFGVVAPRAAAQQTVDRLEGLPGDPLDPRTVADAATARRQILDREIDGALIIGAAGTTDTLLVASGAGRALAGTLEDAVTALETNRSRTLRTVDVAPADTQDANGLTSFYVTVGWCVGGYLCASIMAVSSGAGRTNPRRAVIRLAAMALVGIAAGLGGALIVGPVLGALPGSFAAYWGLGALIVFAVGAATLALQSMLGLAGIGVAILLVVILGNPSAGGALPPPMLPPFWKAIGPALPPGAGTWSARSIAYFNGNALTGPMLVLSAWAVAGTAATLLTAALRGRRPASDLDRPDHHPAGATRVR
ncbi:MULTISPECIES: ABC transporter permease [unclassified Streptomyces]|uniref:ABC transporter permease n=1 Tax=unclassified Streptomyces TaxID=2593676 RepID=UPI003D73F72D